MTLEICREKDAPVERIEVRYVTYSATYGLKAMDADGQWLSFDDLDWWRVG